ncbi:MAG: glycosyl transferase, family 9, partial [Thermoleophilia bacterium]|nr:glycosyl transferase, family 9 [Thermoleophilia bacterium]
TVQEVLVIRPGGLGDVVHAVPALRHLRRTYPSARVTVAAGAPARGLLEACPFVDRSIDLEQPSEAKLERVDVAVSFAPPGESSPLQVADVDARFRASWRADDEGERGAIHPVWPQRLDARTRMLRLAWLLGGAAPGDSDTLGLWPTLADRNGAARLVNGGQRPLAVLHAGAGCPERLWSAQHWARVADLLDGLGLAPVFVGTAVDRAMTDEVIIDARCAPLSLVERTTVGELAGLLERASLFVGSDSGPAALAGALGVRSIVVGPGSMLEHVARPGVVDLVPAGACGSCGEVACMHAPAPAAEVPLEQVLARVGLAAATAHARWHAQGIA